TRANKPFTAPGRHRLAAPAAVVAFGRLDVLVDTAGRGMTAAVVTPRSKHMWSNGRRSEEGNGPLGNQPVRDPDVQRRPGDPDQRLVRHGPEYLEPVRPGARPCQGVILPGGGQGERPRHRRRAGDPATVVRGKAGAAPRAGVALPRRPERPRARGR